MKKGAEVKAGKKGKKDKTASTDKKLIRLTKIKQWYLPADVKSYKRLRKAGVPLLRFHERMLPTVAMIAKRSGIQAEEVSFKETILNPFLDRLSSEWTKLHEDTDVEINSKTIILKTTHADAADEVEPVFKDLEACVERFFERWGYSYTFEVSKKRGKYLVHVNYWYNDSKQPIVHVEDDPEKQTTIELVLGFLKLTLTMDDTHISTVVHTSCGGNWTPVHSSRCLYSQVTNLQPFIEGMFELSTREPQMAERVIPTVA